MKSALLPAGIAVLLLLAALGEGGASPDGLLAVHGGIVALAVLAVLLPAASLEPRCPSSPAWAAFAAFALLAAAGSCLAPYRFAAFLVMQEITAFAAVSFLSARCGPALATRLGIPLLAGAAIEGGVALVQRMGGDLRPAGTFLNPNHLAAWLVAALLIGAGTAGTGRGRPAAWLRASLAVPAVLALFVVGSRGALVALAAGAVTLLAGSWRRLAPRLRAGLAVSAAVLVIAAGAGVAVRFERGDAFRYQRIRIWKACAEAVAMSPWTGTGPGQFATAAANLNFPISGGPLRFSRSFRSTHSDLLRLPAEFGVPAALAALAALALAAHEIARRARAGALPAGASGPIAALVALAVQAVVDNPGERPALHLLAAALVGSLLSTEAQASPARPRAALRATLVAALAVVFLVGDVAPYLAWRSARGLPRGRLDAAGKERLRAALEWNPYQPDLWLRRAEDLASGDDFRPEVYAAAREAAETAARLQPADARYRTGIARVESVACTMLFRDEATRARAAARYDEALERSRHDPFVPIEKGGFLLDLGDPAGARRAAEQALRIEPEAVPPRLLLAEAILAEGKPGAAERAASLLAEAEDGARRWAAWPKGSPYEAHLLSLDAARVRAIRSRLPHADAGLR